METVKQIWATLTAWFYRYVGGLFIEIKDGQKVISIGRVMLICVFLIMAYFWLFKKVQEGSALEMPDMLYETFVALCTYVFGSKVASALKTKWGNNK